MSLDGYKQFSPKVRPHMRRVVFRPHLRIDAPVMEISNKELLGNFIIDCIGQTGKYIVRGGSHGKTKYHFKWVRLAVVDIREVKEELRAYVSPTFRLQRYWYWTD